MPRRRKDCCRRAMPTGAEVTRTERGVHAASASDPNSALVLNPTLLRFRTVKRRERRAPMNPSATIFVPAVS